MLRSVQRNYWIFRQLMAKLHLITYGCQMNEYDSERVAGLLRAERYELTADEQEADLILVNTCAIREKAEEKVVSKLGELRKLKTKNPELIIGVMGCMAQLQQEAIQRRVPAVDLVFGSPAIARVGELVERVRRSEEHTSELQSQSNLVCRLLLEKKKNNRSAAAHRVVIRRHWGLIGIAARSYETVISDHS